MSSQVQQNSPLVNREQQEQLPEACNWEETAGYVAEFACAVLMGAMLFTLAVGATCIGLKLLIAGAPVAAIPIFLIGALAALHIGNKAFDVMEALDY